MEAPKTADAQNTVQSLEQLLAAFDPMRHGGEVMAGGAMGVEAFATPEPGPEESASDK